MLLHSIAPAALAPTWLEARDTQPAEAIGSEGWSRFILAGIEGVQPLDGPNPPGGYAVHHAAGTQVGRSMASEGLPGASPVLELAIAADRHPRLGAQLAFRLLFCATLVLFTVLGSVSAL